MFVQEPGTIRAELSPLTAPNGQEKERFLELRRRKTVLLSSPRMVVIFSRGTLSQRRD